MALSIVFRTFGLMDVRIFIHNPGDETDAIYKPVYVRVDNINCMVFQMLEMSWLVYSRQGLVF